MTILLLTKSLSYEQEFVQKLNSLGHEVLCSKKILLTLQSRNFVKMDLNCFDTLILSETIPDQEVKMLLPFFENYSCTIFRKNDQEMSEVEQNNWRESGISDFIFQTTCFDELRDKLVEYETGFEVITASTEDEDRALDLLCKSLSKQELKVFKVLQQSKGNFVTRESLSYHLWGVAPTNSKESRLSGIIKSLKSKLSEVGFDENSLETSWGRGYAIEELSLKGHTPIASGELKHVGL
ncbi:hypothetical protein IGI39_004419 [Enterococcus sp. AZ135]|uniref:winged helix-turn-helix domain-containing protein n=1 Tax=unclassified Enterococcus TaxID=2608891 RepID=UPI003F28AD3F